MKNESNLYQPGTLVETQGAGIEKQSDTNWSADVWPAAATGDPMPSLPHAAASGASLYCLHSDTHRSLISASHQRSADHGLAPGFTPDPAPLARPCLNQAQDENRLLYQHASPVMETLHEQIANTHSMVLLTSRNGLILHSLGDADFLEKAQRVALMPGVEWSEQSKGTNAIGTALTEERPVVVHGQDHFLRAHQFLTCSCAPIVDPFGKVIGALDVTGDERSFHQHTMALVRMSAQMIENHMFANVFPDALRLHFHSRLEFLNTLVEGIIVFTMDGRFVSANRSAQFQLSLSSNALRAHTFSSLFGLPVSQFFDRLRHAAGQPIGLCLHNGVNVHVQARMRPQPTWLASDWSGDLARPPQASDAGLAAGSDAPAAPVSVSARASGRASLSSLHYLNPGDAQVAAVLHKLQRVQGSDIPIMILGETGTGKDLLARAIHNDSQRARRPFVSINCASIPETLIESELFGYEEGAFTGARRRGSPGKIQMAHGGTLFLDEIGDMPIQLQARLLRVLQERRVTPLGSGKEYEVDVMLICATHCNLKSRIQQGLFRQDLYYRLNGLVLRLPALRERTDFAVVAQKILLSFSGPDRPALLSEEVMRLFQRYRWPGNIRELHNLLRTACAMAGPGGRIGPEHLPEDFLEEVRDSGEGAVLPAGDRALPSASVIIAPLGPEPQTTGLGGVPFAPSVPQAAALPEPPSLPEPAHIHLPGAARLQDVALQAMTETLRRCKGNVSAAAKLLGVSRNTIYRKKDQLPPDVWG